VGHFVLAHDDIDHQSNNTEVNKGGKDIPDELAGFAGAVLRLFGIVLHAALRLRRLFDGDVTSMSETAATSLWSSAGRGKMRDATSEAAVRDTKADSALHRHA
jgi:hypothetical protein